MPPGLRVQVQLTLHGQPLADDSFAVSSRVVRRDLPLDRPAADVVAAAREHGLVVLTAGDDVVRLAPPLTIERSDVDEALTILDRILC